MIYFLIYIVGVFIFCIWDAFIGTGVDWNDKENPPPILPALFWFAVVPLLVLFKFGEVLDRVKYKRLAREASQKRIRIAAEEEAKRFEQEIENEITACRKL